MTQKILIDDFPIEAIEFEKKQTQPYVIAFKFLVTHERYHDVTTLLYKNDFLVKIPADNIEFPATISKYSTSVTNLYEEGSVGEFKLELTEK